MFFGGEESGVTENVEGTQTDTTEFDLDYTGEEPTSEPAPVEENLLHSEEKPSEEGTKEEQSAQEAPTEEEAAPTEEEPKDDVDELTALRNQINELSGLLNQYQQAGVSPQPKGPEQPKVAQPQEPAQKLEQTQPGQVSQLDFFQGQDHIEVLGDAQKLNTLLNQVATVAFTAAVNAAEEKVMRQIPTLVQSSAQQQMAIEKVTKQFYEQNKDLENFRPAVSMAAMQLYNEHPEMKLPELLAEAAKRTRSILHLTQAGVKKGRARTPAQPAGGSVRSGGSNRMAQPEELSDQQKQILDLLY